MAVVTSVQTSALEFGNRIDAELYRPSLRQSFERIFQTDLPVTHLRRVCIIRSGTTPPDRVDGLTSGPILFKTTDIRNGVIPPQADYYRIVDHVHRRMAKTRLEERDVLLNIVGATLDVIGRSAFVSRLEDEANITQAMVFLRCQTPDVLPGFLFAYLNTKYGQDQIARYARPTGQYNLNLQEVGHICIPLLPAHEQRAIEQLILSAGNLQDASMASYAQAEQHLESELGLDKLTYQNPVGYVAQFSDLETSHRSDAQHYQPRFKQLIDHISTCPSARVRDIRSLNRRGLQPIYLRNGDVDVVNSQHLGPKHIDYDGLEKTSAKSFAAAPEAHIKKDDLLIYTTGAYIGRTNAYLSDAPAMASNHVNILRLQPGIDAAYMALVFQSIVGQFQTQQHARGSAQAELYPSDIDRFVVPLLDADKQKAIGDLLRESLAKQQESHGLLEQAKTRVEQLIEAAIQP